MSNINYTVPAFDEFACHGDSVTFEYQGFDIVVTLEVDYDTKPSTDYDCYTEEDIAAWKLDEWHFCTLKVAACREGIELGTTYLGAVEMNFPGTDNSWLSECVEAHRMTEEAIAEARETIQKIAA